MKTDNSNNTLHVPYPQKSLRKWAPSDAPYYAIAAVVRENHHAAIAEGAYFRGERRGFAPGHELEDWLAAETEIKERPITERREL
jgi:hypothetical protein